VLICSGAFILVGCGGGGDKSKSDDTPKPPPPSENMSTFSNTKVDMLINYKNLDNNIFYLSDLNFTINKDNTISGTWNTPYGVYKLEGILSGLNLSQNQNCLDIANKSGSITDANSSYKKELENCFNKFSDFTQRTSTFTIFSKGSSSKAVELCQFSGEIIKNGDQIKINHVNMYDGKSYGDTSCLSIDTSLITSNNYLKDGDIFYWVNSLGYYISENKSLLDQGASIYATQLERRNAGAADCIKLQQNGSLQNTCNKAVNLKYLYSISKPFSEAYTTLQPSQKTLHTADKKGEKIYFTACYHPATPQTAYGGCI